MKTELERLRCSLVLALRMSERVKTSDERETQITAHIRDAMGCLETLNHRYETLHQDLNEIITGERRIKYVLNEIHAERLRQNIKWKRKPGEWASSPFVKLTVLAEEFGEVAEALLERRSIEHLKKELVQVAAVAAAWAEDCESGMEERLHSEVSDRKG